MSPNHKRFAINNEFTATDSPHIYELAFKLSIQPHLISCPRSGEIFIANQAACKLLGYSKKELLSKTTAAIFNLKESNVIKVLARHKAAESLVSITKKNGKQVFCKVTATVFTDVNKQRKAVISITDMSENILQQRNIDIVNKTKVTSNIDIALSKQMNLDKRRIKRAAGEIVVAKTRQRKIDTRKDKEVADDIMLAKSVQRSIDIKKDKIVAENIIHALEKSHDREVANNLLYKKSFNLFVNSSTAVLYKLNILTNTIIISDAYEKEFGYIGTGSKSPVEDWVSHIHRDDRTAVAADFHRALASKDTEWKNQYRYVKADDSVTNVLSRGIIFRTVEGVAYLVIGTMEDLNKQNVLEEKLAEEIRMKELHGAEVLEDAKEAERSDIGRELHDNVNQLLGTSKLYLDMAIGGGPDIHMYLGRSMEYTITAMEAIRTLSKSLVCDTLQNLGLCDAIETISRDTMEVHPVKILSSLGEFKEESVGIKFKHVVYRIIQEQLNNVIKHAKATKVNIGLAQNKKYIILSISDDGVGFDTTLKKEGIGQANIKSRAAAYNGTTDFLSQPGHGCVLTVIFPITEMVTN